MSSPQYRKEHMTYPQLALHKENDKPVIDKLNSVPNKSDYIRQLILKDIEQSKGFAKTE